MKGGESKGDAMEGVSGKRQSNLLEYVGGDLLGGVAPLRSTMLDQYANILNTGGIPQAKVPIIQRAVEAQKQATSQNLRGAQDQLSGAGLADSPFAQGIMSNIRSQGDTAAAGVSAQIGENMFNNAGNMVMGQTTQGLGALGSSAAIAQGAKKAVKGK